MRLFVFPLMIIALLIQAPVPAFANVNQAAAERIADTIGERFPDADIEVSYKLGLVWLKGEAGSQDQKKKIIEQVSQIPGIEIKEVKDEIQVVALRAPASGSPARVPVSGSPAPAAGPVAMAPVPLPASTAAPKAGNTTAPKVAMNTKQDPSVPQSQQQLQPPPQMSGDMLAAYPQQHYQAAYGLKPGQQSAVPAPFAPNSRSMPIPMGQQIAPQYAQQYQPAYGPPAQAANHPEAYGPQGPLPGRYNQPNMPDYAWPAYANYPNYAQVSYPRSYSPKAWPYIGPYYPYPQVPIGWRKVTLEHHDGWWWLDFDDGAPSGPFSGLYRQPAQYTY